MRGTRSRLLRRLAYHAWVELGCPQKPTTEQLYRQFKNEYKRRQVKGRIPRPTAEKGTEDAD